jgi:hypothetical protein
LSSPYLVGHSSKGTIDGPLQANISAIASEPGALSVCSKHQRCDISTVAIAATLHFMFA